MKHILLTGGTGFIGTHLVKHLVENNFLVTVLSRKNSHSIQNIPNVSFYGQVNTVRDLELVFEHNEFDAIIHLATFYSHEPSIDEVENMLESNLSFGVLLLELANRYECKKVINVSSTAEFDSLGRNRPNSLYASTKSAYRNVCTYYEKKHEFTVLNVVLYDNYGSGDTRGKIIDLLINMSKSNASLDMSPGEQIIYPVHIEDTVNAFICCLDNFEKLASLDNNVFFVAPDTGISLRSLAELIEQISDKRLNVNWGALPYRQNENMTPWVGEKLPYWQPTTSLKEGLKTLLSL